MSIEEDCKLECERRRIAEKHRPEIERLETIMADAAIDLANAEVAYKAAISAAAAATDPHCHHDRILRAHDTIESRTARRDAASKAMWDAKEKMWEEQRSVQ